jgi:hypothetical protein
MVWLRLASSWRASASRASRSAAESVMVKELRPTARR